MTSDGKIVPYRMSVLMEIAAKVAKTMVTGAVSLSYEEMEIVLDYIHLNIEDSKRRNEAREKENRDVLKISEFKKAMKSTLKTSGGWSSGM